ncbi:hypothetical protein B0H34DRAFT_785681 [Crassisporium funariophilum]|nr:hypothetical protein B0H34DRAFT_785681 [Crassisporium funariophilum]
MIRAVVFLVDEMEENTIHKAVRDAVSSQLNEFAADLSNFVENTKTSIDSHVDAKLKELGAATDKIADSAKAAVDNLAKTMSQPHTGGMVAHSYSDALTQAPTYVNPRLAARQGIRQQQFMMEGCKKGSRMGKMNDMEMKAEVNSKLAMMGAESRKARSVTRQRNRGLLLEMETDMGAEWIRVERNGKALCEALGRGIHFKARSYNLIAYNSPLEIDPENQDHLQEICEVNGIKEGQLLAMQWAKPIARRSDTQRSAHLILTFTNVDAADRTMITGPCGWNHFAKECTLAMDICGTCADQGHRTSDCPDLERRRCVSCETDLHASWSRECPTFRRKQVDCDNANPENSLPFIPSREAWTGTQEAVDKPDNQPMNQESLQGNAGAEDVNYFAGLQPGTQDFYA